MTFTWRTWLPWVALIAGAVIINRLLSSAASGRGARQREIDAEMDAFGLP
jgi:hypothetical protein